MEDEVLEKYFERIEAIYGKSSPKLSFGYFEDYTEKERRITTKQKLKEILEEIEKTKTLKLWYIECSTGCTCCSDENFYQGFFKTKEEADSIAKIWGTEGNNPLGSKYARYGIYKVRQTEAEVLPDGRILALGQVFDKSHYNKKFYD